MPDRGSALDRIEVRFTTFRDSSGADRARLADRMRQVASTEHVLIETCHRVELVSLDAPTDAPGDRRSGADAVRRVFEVVAGFDSAVVAEEQLLGQVRGAYETALAAEQSGPILNELFRRALRFGRLVRSHARPGTDRSLADPAVAWLRERVPAGTRILVVGTGEISRLIARRVADAGHPVTVVSTSAERGGRVLASLPGGDHHLSVGGIRPPLLAAVSGAAIAVRSRDAALTDSMLPARELPPVVDLSSPSAVDVAAATRLGDRLLDLDHLSERIGGTPALSPDSDARLRRRLDEEVDGFVAWLGIRQHADAVSLLNREADAVRRRHLERLRRRAALDEAQLAAVEAASAAMLGELLHGPMIELRHGGADAATIRRLFRIDA